jgi:ribonucleoside-diphosphate reductase alpha chain
MEIGWMSNNSVALKPDDGFEDFSYIPDMAKRNIDNGEPGLINLYNMQKYGRYGKESPDEANLCNPCGEICLESFELCNLSETFPHRCADLETFNKALKFAAFYSTSVSLLPTHRPETNAVIARNRRIGVSISGIAQWVSGAAPAGWGLMNYTRLTRVLRDGYKIVKDENTRLAKAAGVPPSIRVTTIKPSGSISLLAGATAGVHYPVSRYAIRRMRIGNDSPLVPALKEAGIPHEPDTYSDNTLVFEFAIDHGDVRPCEEVSPWEQFCLVAMLQRCWADNMVSATVYFDKEKDAKDVEKLLAMFIPVLKSVSMLPHSGHGYAQAPYEPIDVEEYEKRRTTYTKPKFASVKGSVPMGSKFCDGDSCEL